MVPLRSQGSRYTMTEGNQHGMLYNITYHLANILEGAKIKYFKNSNAN